MVETTDIDDGLFSPEAIRDPYAYFGRLRELDPVHWNAEYELWLVTRYDDVAWVSRQPQLFSSATIADDGPPAYPAVPSPDGAEASFVRANLRGRLTVTDPPAHRTQRASLQPFFTAAEAERWRVVIQTACATLLDGMSGRRQMDVMGEFAVPLPLNVICEVMAIPQRDRRWVRSVAEHLLIGPRSGPSRARELADAMRGILAYVEPLAEERSANPGDDLVSLVMAGEAEGIFTRSQALQNIILLLVAGHETTINLICNGLLAFINHPDQWERLRSDPAGLAASATEECLRYDPPVKSVERLITRDVELRGKQMHAGDRVRVVIASANRDPNRFDEPDTFDIGRTPNAHLAFGHGVHLCLGATLARIEGEEVLKVMAERFERFSLVTERLDYAPAVDLRSLAALAVAW